MHRWRADGAALALLAAAVVLVVHPALGGHLPAVRDMPGFTVPSRWFWRTSILHGELPAWNALVAFGVPAFAAPVHGSLYPGHLLLLLGPFATAFGMTWAAHAVWAGVGGYVLARGMACRPQAALLSGLVWAIGGYAVAMWWNGEKTLSDAWVPWVAWSVGNLARGPRFRASRLAVAALAGALLCAAGDPFLLFDAVLFALPVAFEVAEGDSRARSLRAAGSMAASMAAALLVAAPVLLPALLLRAETERAAAFSREVAERWSLHPVRWLELFVPVPLGDPLQPEVYHGAPYSDDPTVQVLPWAVSLYVGASTLAFATHAPWRRARAMWIGGAVALLAALGAHTPIHALLRAVIPPLALARYPEKHVLAVVGVVALLASLGVERVLDDRRPFRRLAAVALAGLAAAVVLAPAPLRATTLHGAVQAAVVLGVTAAALFATSRAPLASWAIPVIALLDLSLAGRPLLSWLPSDALDPPPMARQILAPPHPFPPRIYRPRSSDDVRVETLDDNIGSLFGIAAVPGHDPARPPLPPIAPQLADGARLAEWMRLDALLLPREGEEEARLLGTPPRPRAWMVARIQPVLPADTPAALADPHFDLEASALVEGSADGLPAPLRGADPRPLGGCAPTLVSPTAVTIQCEAPAPAWLVLAEGMGTGWEAEVDGVARPVLRTNALFRGVALGAGTHVAAFRYRVPGLVEGALVALLAALTLALLVVRERKGSAPLA